MSDGLSHRGRLCWMSLFIIGLITLDQGTKVLAQHVLFHRNVMVWPVFNLILVHNTGVAFGFWADQGHVVRWLLVGIRLSVCCTMLYVLYRAVCTQTHGQWALACLLGGGMGNVVDQLYRGYVIDFMQWHWHHWYFPVFNVADVLLCVGGMGLGYACLYDRNRCS